MVYAELWTSFASLLRVYTAAHGLNQERQAHVELSEGRILVRRDERWLSIKTDGAFAEWQREDGRQSAMTMNEYGQLVCCDQEAKEMDMVAEEMARELMR